MSNRQVPAVYRNVMNDVVENVRADFDEAGVEEAVLQALLRSWETKIAQSRVADFTQDPRMGAIARQFPVRTLGEVMANVNAAAAAAASSSTTTTTPATTASTTTTANGESANGAPTATSEEGGKGSTEKGKQEGGSSHHEDDDEINSDLDDSDDEKEGEENGEDDATGDLVIALYEKVQRVKNKWKITLKDGLISVGGRDYLFSKCQGEFEW